MDVVDLLTADHNRMRGLFAQFTTAKNADDAHQMRHVAEQLIAELQAHEQFEERVFYETVHDDSTKIAAQVAEGYEEHHVADVIMAELRELDPADEQWLAKVKVLIESVEHHIDEEEEDLFVSVRKERSEQDLLSLRDRVEEMKDQLGAPSPADAEGLTKKRLLQLAGEQRIPGRSHMDVDELAATVDAREVSAPS